jgi:hypothetical protein
VVANSEPIPLKDMAEGDMIAWDSHPEWGTPHLGIYMGSGLYAEVRPGGMVQMSELASAPPGYLTIGPPKPVETGAGYNRPVRDPQAAPPPAPVKTYDATPGGMVRPPQPAPTQPVKPAKPAKPTKPTGPTGGGHLADGYV